MGSGVVSPGSPAGKGEAELTGFARGRARESARWGASSGDVGAARPELRQLTLEGVWPRHPDPRRRAASKDREP